MTRTSIGTLERMNHFNFWLVQLLLLVWHLELHAMPRLKQGHSFVLHFLEQVQLTTSSITGSGTSLMFWSCPAKSSSSTTAVSATTPIHSLVSSGTAWRWAATAASKIISILLLQVGFTACLLKPEVGFWYRKEVNEDCLPYVSNWVMVVEVNCIKPEGIKPGLVHALHISVVICNTKLLLTNNRVHWLQLRKLVRRVLLLACGTDMILCI